MRFKITKGKLELLLKCFEKQHTEFAEIELEPVIDTATQAIYEQDLKNRHYKMGLERGYREGFYDGSCPEKRMKCFCGDHHCVCG